MNNDKKTVFKSSGSEVQGQHLVGHPYLYRVKTGFKIWILYFFYDKSNILKRTWKLKKRKIKIWNRERNKHLVHVREREKNSDLGYEIRLFKRYRELCSNFLVIEVIIIEFHLCFSRSEIIEMKIISVQSSIQLFETMFSFPYFLNIIHLLFPLFSFQFYFSFFQILSLLAYVSLGQHLYFKWLS